MPYRDPHTAGPALWALRHATGCDFEVSVAPIAGSTPWRKGLECVAISLYRQGHGASPTVNFGRMPAGYLMSSGNNARLVAANKRFRGGPTTEEDASHTAGLAPIGELAGDPLAPHWGGHDWSAWAPFSLSTSPTSRLEAGVVNGLYRIRRSGDKPALLYIGQGRVVMRLGAHQRTADRPELRQASIFTGRLDYSAVLNETWLPHQRLELENDLIAAYILHTGAIPAAQFLG